MNKARKAVITEVKANWYDRDPWTQRMMAGHVRAKDETGEEHIFVNGSPNRVLDVKVGDEGTVEYVSAGSMALWHWSAK